MRVLIYRPPPRQVGTRMDAAFDGERRWLGREGVEVAVKFKERKDIAGVLGDKFAMGMRLARGGGFDGVVWLSLEGRAPELIHEVGHIATNGLAKRHRGRDREVLWELLADLWILSRDERRFLDHIAGAIATAGSKGAGPTRRFLPWALAIRWVVENRCGRSEKQRAIAPKATRIIRRARREFGVGPERVDDLERRWVLKAGRIIKLLGASKGGRRQPM